MVFEQNGEGPAVGTSGPNITNRRLSFIAVITVLLAASASPIVTPGPGARAQSITGSIYVGGDPSGIAANSTTNKIYISNWSSNKVLVVDGSSHRIIRAVGVGAPQALAVDEERNKIYCASEGGNVTVLNGATDTVSKEISFGTRASRLSVDPVRKRLYATNFDAGTLSVVDTVTDTVIGTIAVGDEPYDARVNPVTGKLYVRHNNRIMTVVDGSTHQIVKTINLPHRPTGLIGLNAYMNEIYVGVDTGGVDSRNEHHNDSALIIDGSTDSAAGYFPTGPEPFDIQVNPTDNTIFVSNDYKRTITIVNGVTHSRRTDLSIDGNPRLMAVNTAANEIYVINPDQDDPESGKVTIITDPAGSEFFFAEGTTRPDFEPYFCIQNLDNGPAAVKITYMLGDGTTKEETLQVAPHSRATVDCRKTLGTGDDPSHDFSARVECTNGRRIVAERPMYFNYKGAWTGGTDVIGASGSNRGITFAEGSTRPGIDPYVCVQNPGEASVNVRAYYLPADEDALPGHLETDIPAHSRMTLHPSDIMGSADDSAHDFSIGLEAGPGGDWKGTGIVVERPTYFNYQGKWTGGHDVMGTATPSSCFYFAEGTTRPDFDTYFCLSFPSGDASKTASVKVTYMTGSGATKHQYVTLPHASRATLHPADVLGTGDDPSHDFSAKVECTNGQMIVAERPTYFNYKGKWTGGHDVMGTTAPSKSFCFAEGTTRPGFDTYFCVQNPGGKTARVKITFMRADGLTKEHSIEVDAHSRATVFAPDILGRGDDPSHDFSARVECTNGQDIVVERPMYFDYHGWTGGHNVVGYQD